MIASCCDLDEVRDWPTEMRDCFQGHGPRYPSHLMMLRTLGSSSGIISLTFGDAFRWDAYTR